jgi:hypothetical protein
MPIMLHISLQARVVSWFRIETGGWLITKARGCRRKLYTVIRVLLISCGYQGARYPYIRSSQIHDERGRQLHLVAQMSVFQHPCPACQCMARASFGGGPSSNTSESTLVSLCELLSREIDK